MLRLFRIQYQPLKEVSFFLSILEETPITQQYKIFSFSLGEGMDEGALVDGLADDLKAALILISSWNTSKGTAGTPDEYCNTVVSPTPPPLHYYYNYYHSHCHDH